jgi:GWxTD domain-containing protein
MNNFVSLLVLSISLSISAFGQNAKQLKAFVDHKSFFAPEIGTYVEIQLQFIGYTLNYFEAEAKDGETTIKGLQSEVAVQLVIKNSAGENVAGDTYRLKSPLMRDSIIEDFYDIRRFTLLPGNYELDVTLQDLNSNEVAMSGRVPLSIKPHDSNATISDIQIAEVITTAKSDGTFTKSGFDILPRISNYFPTQANSLPVYLEVYSRSLDSTVVGLKQSIVHVKTKQEVEEFTRFSRLNFKQIQPFIRNIDITNLKSGEYMLEYTIMSPENKELSKTSYFFERTNDNQEFMSADNVVLDPAFQGSIAEDSVTFFMASLIPISQPAEVKNIISILKKKDKEQCRKYIQAFWTFSATEKSPYEAWLSYKSQVNLVQKLYSNNFMDGFETDRGRVYLQYGAPNSIIARETSPSEYPYEIWVYDKIKIYSNRRFVFYNPDLVNNAYRLLHSDMVGELQNYRWQQALAKRNSPNRDIDDPNDGNYRHWGGNSKELYDQR